MKLDLLRAAAARMRRALEQPPSDSPRLLAREVIAVEDVGKGANHRVIAVFRRSIDQDPQQQTSDIDRMRAHEARVWSIRKPQYWERPPASRVRGRDELDLCGGSGVYLGVRCPGCAACAQG